MTHESIAAMGTTLSIVPFPGTRAGPVESQPRTQTTGSHSMTEPAVRFIDPPTSNDRLVALEIDGRFTADDMTEVAERMKAIADRGEKALLFVEWKGKVDVQLAVINEKLRHLKTLWSSLGRYALVGDRAWLETMVKVADALTPQQMKHFSTDERDQAFAWLTDEDAGA